METELILNRAKPLDSALKFLAAKRPNVIRQQREWLDYDGHAYVSIEDDTIAAELAAWASTAKVVVIKEVMAEDEEGRSRKWCYRPRPSIPVRSI